MKLLLLLQMMLLFGRTVLQNGSPKKQHRPMLSDRCLLAGLQT